MKILITGAWQGYQGCKETILNMGHEVEFLQWEKDPLPCDPVWVEAIIGNGIFLSHPIEEFTNLRYIQITSAGYDRVPVKYIREHEIELHNARGVYSIPMAEFALCGILHLYKKYSEFAQRQKYHKWEKVRTIRELNQNKVCIIGCGSVGTECAKRLKAFGCRVEGIDLYPQENEYYDQIKGLNAIDDSLQNADIIILTVPLTQATRNLMNKQRIESLKENATIINIARGEVMDYDAFVEYSPKKHLSGVFDVFPEEPLSQDSPLWGMENVIVTPHNSFQGEGNIERLNKVILGNLCGAVKKNR